MQAPAYVRDAPSTQSSALTPSLSPHPVLRWAGAIGTHKVGYVSGGSVTFRGQSLNLVDKEERFGNYCKHSNMVCVLHVIHKLTIQGLRGLLASWLIKERVLVFADR